MLLDSLDGEETDEALDLEDVSEDLLETEETLLLLLVDEELLESLLIELLLLFDEVSDDLDDELELELLDADESELSEL